MDGLVGWIVDANGVYCTRLYLSSLTLAPLPEFGKGDVLKLNLAQAVMLEAINEVWQSKGRPRLTSANRGRPC